SLRNVSQVLVTVRVDVGYDQPGVAEVERQVLADIFPAMVIGVLDRDDHGLRGRIDARDDALEGVGDAGVVALVLLLAGLAACVRSAVLTLAAGVTLCHCRRR